MAFSWLPAAGLVVLCTHKDDSTDDLALYLLTYEDFKLTVSAWRPWSSCISMITLYISD